MVSESFIRYLETLIFPVKLYKLAESEEIKSIKWSRGGTSVKLDTEILPRECFVEGIFNVADCKHVFRQLSYYGFHRISRTSKVWEFEHPSFRADRFDLVQALRRPSKKKQNVVRKNYTAEELSLIGNNENVLAYQEVLNGEFSPTNARHLNGSSFLQKIDPGFHKINASLNLISEDENFMIYQVVLNGSSLLQKTVPDFVQMNHPSLKLVSDDESVMIYQEVLNGSNVLQKTGPKFDQMNTSLKLVSDDENVMIYQELLNGSDFLEEIHPGFEKMNSSLKLVSAANSLNLNADGNTLTEYFSPRKLKQICKEDKKSVEKIPCGSLFDFEVDQRLSPRQCLVMKRKSASKLMKESSKKMSSNRLFDLSANEKHSSTQQHSSQKMEGSSKKRKILQKDKSFTDISLKKKRQDELSSIMEDLNEILKSPPMELFTK